MLEFFSRLFRKRTSVNPCSHVFELVDKFSREIELSAGRSYTVEDVYIYCPRCRTRSRVTPMEWKLIQKEQKIDAEYMKRNDIQYLEVHHHA